MQFKEFGFSPSLMEGLEAIGFETATPVQEQAIPLIMQNQDMIACAQTGTGKTAAFLLPIINRLIVDPPDGIDTIIIEPTRELAIQVDQQLEGLSYFTPISSLAIYGGRDGQAMEQEKRALKQGVNLIVATPGRFIAHLQMGYVNLDKVRHLVLDEADRMLDMGFVQDIMSIIYKLPRERQTLLFSATMPKKIRDFCKMVLRDPQEISISVSKPAENIFQACYVVDESLKLSLLESLLKGKDKQDKRILIFAGTKRKVKAIASALMKLRINAGDIQSDLEQEEREERLRAFKSGRTPVLVATDILSRGIDIKDIEVVINFDVPGDAEDYVHRIGRTARAEASGVALTFINKQSRRKFENIEKLMGMKVRQLPLPPNLEVGPELAGGSGKRGGRDGSRSGGGGNRGGRGGDRNRSRGKGRRGGKSDDRRSGSGRRDNKTTE